MKDLSINISSIEEYAKYLRNRITLLESKLNSLPEERLTFSQKSNNTQFYYRRKGNKKLFYISKKSSEELAKLANKYYITKVLPPLKANLYAAEKFVELHSGKEERDVFNCMPEDLQMLNHNLFLYKPQYIKDWLNRPYVRNPYKSDALIFDTARGDKVRSKSEVILSNSFFKYGLIYLVEFPLRLKHSGKTIYPDFTILNTNTMETIYWEHFGMMDNPEYATAAIKKIQLLQEERLILGKNLICTFETSTTPLSSSLVESYIKEFFLD